MSAQSRREPPANALAGKSRLGWCPTNGRIKCGTMSPTNQITPAIAVHAPMHSAVPDITSMRIRDRLTPRLTAVSSPRLSTSSERELAAKNNQPITMKGVESQT